MFFIFDNRLPSTSSFDLENSLAQYHRLNASLLGKYLSISSIHPWALRPKYILVAASPDKTKIIAGDQTDPSKVISLLEPRFMQVNVSTLEIYLPGAITNIMHIVSKFPNATEKVFNVVFVTNSQSLGLGVHWDNAFIKLKDAFMTHPKIRLNVRIVCVALESTPSFDERVYRIQRSLQGISAHSTVQFVPIVNSRLHYDAELRNIVALHAPRLRSTLSVPKVKKMKLVLSLLIEPCTMRAADTMHSGLSQLEPHSILSRAGVAPHLIEGFALRVLPHPFAKDAFTSESSYHQNNVSYHCLAKLLSVKDTVLVLKVSLLSVCDQYWALVPPAVESLQSEDELCGEMIMVRLVDCDSLLPSIAADSIAVGGDLRDRLACNSRRTLLRDYETEDLEATSEYLCDAVVGTLGPHTEYNPFACPSGRLGYLLDSKLQVATAKASGPTAAPIEQATPPARATTVTKSAPAAAKSNAKVQPAQAPAAPKSFAPAHYQPPAAAPPRAVAPVAYPPLDVRVRSGGCSEWDDASPVGTKPRTNRRLTKIADTRGAKQKVAEPITNPQVVYTVDDEDEGEDEEGEEVSSDAESLFGTFFGEPKKRKPVASGRGRGASVQPRKQATKSTRAK